MSDGQDQEPMLEDENRTSSKKRTAEDEPNVTKEQKKRKRKTVEDFGDYNDELQLDLSIGRLNGQMMADHIARQTKRFEPELSMVELEERRVPECAFLDTSEWAQERTLNQLPAFLERFTKQSRKALSKAPERMGSPHTIVITMAGIRAADVTRELRVYETQSAKVAKLFAKHIKLKDAIKDMKGKRMNIGVGTPQRLIDLVQEGAISLSHLKRIIVDASWSGQKRRGILDLPETQRPLSRLLALRELRERYNAEIAANGEASQKHVGKVDILVF